ncbi:MAG TPA: ATP-grasp domain-containing protein [Candidatus Acidoferrales bacterium]
MSADFPQKRILILASKLGYQTRAFADAAKKLGVEVALGTDRCHKLDDPWGDGAMALHFEDAEGAASEIVRETISRPANAILALGDRPTATAARAARALGLKGNSVEAVEICRNKLRQRERLKAAGLRVPDFVAFGLDENIDSVDARVSFPCVVKPLALAASQGVIRTNNADEFRRAVERIRALFNQPEIQATRDGTVDRVLVEQYIPGVEVAVEGLISGGRLRVLAIFDKPDALEGPYFEETIYVTPSRLPQQTQAAVADCASRCVAALGLVTGPVHAEFRINGEGVWVIEAAPRPIGGLCSRALRFGSDGISLEELILRHALELGDSESVREDAAAGVMMIPVPRSGILEGVEGIDAARDVPGIEDVLITARLRDNIVAWPEGASYLGFIFSRGDSAGEAEAALRLAHSKLKFVIGARLAVEHPVTGRITA